MIDAYLYDTPTDGHADAVQRQVQGHRLQKPMVFEFSNAHKIVLDGNEVKEAEHMVCMYVRMYGICAIYL
jgi:hypothetical protein